MKSKNGGKTLKRTFILTLACMLLVFGAVFAATDAGEPYADQKAKVSDLLANDESVVSQQVTACDGLATALLTNRITTRESVGTPVFNAQRRTFDKTEELDGFTAVSLKPKIDSGIRISSTLGFSGLGGNHYARADV